MRWFLKIIALAVAVIGKQEQHAAPSLEWWETALIYHIYPRSFMDSDGDGIGDINGITARLEYLKELGVDAACLSPIFKSPMYDFGYDTSDYYAIHSEYGTMEDFEQLLRKAADFGIKIILDMAVNHVSNESEWFTKSVNRDEYYNDWFIWENGHIDDCGVRKPPNNWISMFRNSAWTLHASRDQFYLHQFGASQPDLNFRNPVVVEEFKTILRFWLEKGVAGIVMRSVNHVFEVEKEAFGGRYPDEPITNKPGLTDIDYGYLDHIYTKDIDDIYDFVAVIREVVDSMSLRDNVRRILITEASSTNIKKAVNYYGDHKMGAHVPLNTYLMDLNKQLDARDLKYTIDKWLTYKPMKKVANWMTGNHDKQRLASKFRPELVDAFNMILLLLPGVAMAYMGEEIGMVNGFVPWTETKDPLACNTDPVNFVDISRDPIRTPFQWNNDKNAGFSVSDNIWLPVAEGYESLNVAGQRSAVRSHYQVYRTLTNLRIRPAFRLGRYESLALNKDVFAFKRWYNDDTYIIVMNVGKTYRVVNLTSFDLIFGQLEVEVSSILSSRTYSDNVQSTYLDLAADEALVLRMQV